MRKRMVSFLMCLLLLTGLFPLEAKASGAMDETVRNIYVSTGDYLENQAKQTTPVVNSIGGEWLVFGLVRSERAEPTGYYENVVAYVEKNINEKEQLHWAKGTDNSRVILTLTAAGYDVTNIAGHNLLMGLTDLTYVKKQGINGPIWALIAFDTHGYEIPVNPKATQQVTRENLITTILGRELATGGWALSGKSADPDMTGMAIQSLAPYYTTNEEVKAAVDRAITALSNAQQANGGYGSWGTVNVESCAQVVVALTSLGINPDTDSRFIKNGVSVLDAMCQFYVEGGGFRHTPTGDRNGMATEQGYYALVSYERFLKGQSRLYDMTDVAMKKEQEPSKIPDTTTKPVVTSKPAETTNKNSEGKNPVSGGSNQGASNTVANTDEAKTTTSVATKAAEQTKEKTEAGAVTEEVGENQVVLETGNMGEEALESLPKLEETVETEGVLSDGEKSQKGMPPVLLWVGIGAGVLGAGTVAGVLLYKKKIAKNAGE